MGKQENGKVKDMRHGNKIEREKSSCCHLILVTKKWNSNQILLIFTEREIILLLGYQNRGRGRKGGAQTA